MVSSLEGNGGDLMDQCSWHDTPPAFSVNLTDWLGRDLGIGLKALSSEALTSQWLGRGLEQLLDEHGRPTLIDECFGFLQEAAEFGSTVQHHGLPAKEQLDSSTLTKRR